MGNELRPFEAMEIGLTPSQLDRYGIKDPQQVVALAKEVAKYVESNALSVSIQGSRYVMVEGWQFAASLLGLIGKPTSFKNESSYDDVTFEYSKKNYNTGKWEKQKHTTQKYKYFAEASFYTPEGQEISKGFAMCSNEEQKKHTFDEYSILSMAQTRALGKAARMSFAFLIKAAGYSPTPLEEVNEAEENNEVSTDVPLTEELENEILMHTDGQQLSDWANALTEHHGNANFVQAVKLRLIEIAKANGNYKPKK